MWISCFWLITKSIGSSIADWLHRLTTFFLHFRQARLFLRNIDLTIDKNETLLLASFPQQETEFSFPSKYNHTISFIFFLVKQFPSFYSHNFGPQCIGLLWWTGSLVNSWLMLLDLAAKSQIFSLQRKRKTKRKTLLTKKEKKNTWPKRKNKTKWICKLQVEEIKCERTNKRKKLIIKC